MVRFQDWTIRLDAYLRWVGEEAFSWGSHDCALFVCNCVREMTGEDPAAEFRNRYEDIKGAAQLLLNGGLEKMVEEIAVRLQVSEVSPFFAQRGDVVLLDPGILYGSVHPYIHGSGGPALAIVDLTGERVVGPGALGLVSCRLSQARRAWRI